MKQTESSKNSIRTNYQQAPVRRGPGRPRKQGGEECSGALTEPDKLALRDFDNLPGSAFVSVRVVSRLLGMSTSGVWSWIRKGILPAPTKLAAQTTRWTVADVRNARAKLTGER